MLMATDIRLALDPALIGERVGLQLDPWQTSVVRERPHRGLWLCSRQSGKTTTALLMTLWTVLYEAPALVLIVSPSQRQSGEAFRSFMQLYHRLDGAPELRAESALRAELANDSRVVALPGTERTVRGYAGTKLIVIDEASRVEDELIAALRPMLATVDGSLIALTTPFGRRGWFYEAWTGDDPSWTRVRVPASECPRLSKEFLESELKALGGLAFAEEYDLAFNDSSLQMFPSALIEAAFNDPSVRPLWA